MDMYHARKRQFGGGFNVTVPITAADTEVTLREIYVAPVPDPTMAVLLYTLHIQRLEIVVVTGSGGKTWSVADDNLDPVLLTGPKSAATSNTRYTYDFGPEGVELNAGNTLLLIASAAGAAGYVVVEGYNSAITEPLAVVQVAPDTGSIAGGESVELTVQPTETGCRVFFGAVEATVTDVDEENYIVTVTTPAHAAGVVDISVRNPSQLKLLVLEDGFTYS